MAEKKKHNIVSASSVQTGKPNAKKPAAAQKPTLQQAAPVGNATGLRIGAIALWVLAIAFEVLAILVLSETINLKFMPTMWQLILLIVLDLICVIIGAQLWKRANHIDPAEKKNAVKFWLWNNMGVLVCVVAFVPIIILLLTNKELDKKTKTIATVVAIIALLIGGVASYDWNPVEKNEKSALLYELEQKGITQVYWTASGHKFHSSEDCQALNNSETLYQGSPEQAFDNTRINNMCKFCANREGIDLDALTSVEVPAEQNTDADVDPAA